MGVIFSFTGACSNGSINVTLTLRREETFIENRFESGTRISFQYGSLVKTTRVGQLGSILGLKPNLIAFELKPLDGKGKAVVWVPRHRVIKPTSGCFGWLRTPIKVKIEMEWVEMANERSHTN
jgi:hypothetical protein